MNDYTYTFLADVAGLLALAGMATWGAAHVARRRPFVAVGLVVASLAMVWWLGAYLGPLLSGTHPPDDLRPLERAQALPFVVVGCLAAARTAPGWSSTLDGPGLLPLALGAISPVGLFTGCMVLARGWMSPRRSRAMLWVGTTLVLLAAVLDHERIPAQGLVQQVLPVSFDNAVRTVGASVSTLQWVGHSTLAWPLLDVSDRCRRQTT